MLLLVVAVLGVLERTVSPLPDLASLKNSLLPYSSYVVDERALDAFPDASYGVVFGAAVAVSGTGAYY